MALQIQFATRPDGARIAFTVVGNGPPLVYPPGWATHQQHIWKEPRSRSYREALAERHTLICYDKHGTGLSDRDRQDFTLEGEVSCLEAVVNYLGLKRFALMGSSEGGPIALAYAARHPDIVSRLILYATFANGHAIADKETQESMLSLVRANWGIGSRTLADISNPGASGEDLEGAARRQRETAQAEMAAQLMALVYRLDVTSLLPKVTMPTLVLHRTGDRAIRFRLGRELASQLPHARLIALEGNAHPAWEGDTGAVLEPLLRFLAEEEAPSGLGEASVPSGLLTILFTDMESSAALRQREGDAKAQELVRVHNAIVREALKAHEGSEIKHTGDGIMASFASASQALQSAVAVQRGVAAHVEEHPDAALRVYIGLNAGEPIVEEGDLFGTSVDLAKRICDQCQPGEILISDVVRQLVAGKEFLFSDRGETALRGFEDPVRLYEVSWRED